MTMDKTIINTFKIWQMTMGKISTFTMNNITFPSFAAPNTSSATSCAKRQVFLVRPECAT